MSDRQARHGMTAATMAMIGLTLLGGCSHIDPVTVNVFLTDFLRNAVAALLL